VDDSELKSMRKVKFNAIDILRAPNADRGYTIAELEDMTGISEMTIRHSLQKTAGVLSVQRLLGRNWTSVYFLDNKANRKFFELEDA